MGRDTDGEYLADQVVREINEIGGRAAANYDSVATMAGGTSIINTAIQNFGRNDILVNNAGNFVKASTIDLTEAQWDAIMAVHMKGHFACAQPAIKEMMKQKHGRIINVSSMAAARGIGVAYCSAKAGDPWFHDKSCHRTEGFRHYRQRSLAQCRNQSFSRQDRVDARATATKAQSGT